jgi:photosystem II stability/assembly factor-like uncharacterized protein
MKTLTFCAFTLLHIAVSGMEPVFATPLPDRLERPSLVSPGSVQAPLTDVQSVGQDLVMIGESGHILIRDAKGETSQSKVPVDLLLTALHFIDAHEGWAVGHDGVVLHSTDAGKTWTKQLDGSQISPLLLERAQAEITRLEDASTASLHDEDLTAALDNAYFALDDAKASGASGPSRPLLDVWFRNANEGWAVGAYGMIVHTKDGGKNWDYVSSLVNPDRLHLNAVLGLSDGTLLVAGEGGNFYRSEDDGKHWQPTQQLTQASLYKLMQLTDGRLIALGFGGTLLSSPDQGKTWKSIKTPAAIGLYGARQLADGSLVLSGQGGILLYSRDGEHFRLWQGADVGSVMGVEQISDQLLALTGSSGLQVISLDSVKEQLQ